MTPPAITLRRRDTHRLIPSRFGDAPPPAHDSERAATDRLEQATRDTAPPLPGGPDPAHLVADVPWAHIINAAFSFAHPQGSRFNGPDRGAWYAGFDRATSIAEVAWHRSLLLADLGWPPTAMTFDDWLADFAGAFHDLRGPGFAACLAPNSHVTGQRLAARLLARGSGGVVYPSVRRPAGTCLACFRPMMVQHLRRHTRLRFTWTGPGMPKVVIETRY